MQAVNFTKAQPYNSRLFKMSCNDKGNEYEALILNTEFSCLSRAKVLVTVFQLSEEIAIYLSEIETPLASYFSDVPWLQQLACLGDIFSKLMESVWRGAARPR